jgi:hydrogenase expression/formation protein HypE
VVIGHGGGGKLSAELIEHLFLPAFGRVEGAEMHDAATLTLGGPAGGRLAFSTDSYVVRPLFFPGGCIGDLAVNGTINDVAMSGAVPIALSAGFIVEEGLELATLGTVAERWGTRHAPPASRSSRATPRWSTPGSPTGSTSTPPASA